MAPRYATYPSLNNKRVVITGGAEGIGAAAATRFAHQGSKVHILDISTSAATALIDSIRASATPTTKIPTFHHCDVTDLSQLRSAADTILSAETSIEVLVNNAASAGGSSRVTTLTATPEDWDSQIAVSLRHQFFLTQYLAPHMPSDNTASIVNMGSITWRIPAVGLPIYTACKAAVMGLTRTHAREFGERGVRVNSVMPGSIATERQRREVLTAEYEAETMRAQALKRVLGPEEVASVILFLASDDSSGVTGSSYCVDGGWVGDP